MIKKEFPSTQHIIDCLNTHYNIQVATLTLLPLGADINASVYKAQADDNSTYFMKIKYEHHHDISVIVQQMLHDDGIQGVIAPLKTNQNQTVQYINNFSLIVYPFIEGDNGFVKDLTAEPWITLGKTLKQIHEFKIPETIKTHIKQEAYSSQWRDFVRSLHDRIENIQTHDEITLKFLDYFKQHKAIIERLLEQAERLAEKLKKSSPEFVLCHADIHAGNVLITKDDAIYIVDWDSPIMAPKERDLMFIGGGIGNIWNNPHEEKLFYAGYGNTQINQEILTYYRCERIVIDIAEYSEQLLSSHNQLTGYNEFIAMFEPNGVVDIALKAYNIKN